MTLKLIRGSKRRVTRVGLVPACLLSFALVAQAQQLAFPGAEGGGMFTKGGRGGKVLEVTRLDDDANSGTLRWAVNQSGARTVIFRVSGTILLTSDLKISRDSITIAGQTAPGDGICLRKYALVVSANEVIIRYVRVRLGDESGGESDAMSAFTNATTGYKNHIIVDHCSASWSQDETLSYYGNDYVTVQWCIISESLYNSSHPKGSHGYGGIWGGVDHTSFHHNLLAHHSSRNPRLSGLGTTVACHNIDLRNNVIYNWGFNSAYGGEASTANFVNNYYKPGPATKSGVRSRIYQPSDTLGLWYIQGNYVEGNPTVSNDNWAGGVNPSIAPSNLNKLKTTTPFPSLPVTTHSAQQSFDLVLQYAGATFPKRDTIDRRIVYETRTGAITYGGKTYAKAQGFDTTKVYGIIDSQTDVGGWPVLNSVAAPLDSDHDGMPDSWEIAQGLDLNNAADRNKVGAGGYTMLELYLNSQVGSDPSTATAIEERNSHPVGFMLEQNYPNPFNPSTNIEYRISKSEFVTLKVFDVLGREIATLVNAQLQPGSYQATFDASHLASGVYLYQLRAGEFIQTQRMVLAK
ncbi:MAG: T9SS type A sorting domain-containing protein [Ignavibacteriales bacterium]|nr:T9SS type A sorting domain-containing protein [Ignavibacteriales bacterium]